MAMNKYTIGDKVNVKKEFTNLFPKNSDFKSPFIIRGVVSKWGRFYYFLEAIDGRWDEDNFVPHIEESINSVENRYEILDFGVKK